ncbi:AMP-binding protein [Aquamicrobium sp. LC103]|uniref:class I adenylate-forming enzyme family protein n=1 Tax=Aquamicrobium sp. LC103 TaxID=1120658 RepID=UPI00063E8FDA|nr:AMP-binding protein [Aquamicrobium sp. LC103]TKT82484.1 long-chain fatty acid--CoA ligase [Aquamicrobium sp. LC103]
MNVHSMLTDAIRRRGDETAIRWGGQHLTYRDFDGTCAALGDWFAARGCKRGDRVLIFLRNGFEFPALLLAPMRAGLVVVPTNAKLHPREVAWIAGDAEPRLIFTHAEHVEELKAGLPEGLSLEIIAIEDFALPTPLETPGPSAEVDPDEPAWIFYTSGTTGKPKGATLSHRNLIAATVNCLADVFPFHETDRLLHVAPLSHGSGLYMLPALARGAENVIHERTGFRPDEVFDTVARLSISVIPFVAPTMIVRFLETAPRADIGSLRGIVYGGASIHLEHIRAAVARFGPIFHQLYGQGEAPMTISYLPGADHLDADDETLVSAGYVRSGIEVRLVDEDGRDVANGEDGEICVRGDVVMKGYWRNPEATAKALKDGWLHTGDIGHFDGGGRLRVLDRRHDTIISGGTNIYPKEVEDVVAAHGAVREVIAFGLPDAEWGESVAVALVSDDPALDADAVLAFCKDNLASFKKPKHIFFVPELPKNAYGKVLRRELKERFTP